MIKAAHTKGPWFARQVKGGDWYVGLVADVTPGSCYVDTVVAEVRDATPDSTEATARLLAAAPELARALNDCLIVMESADAGDSVAAKLAREALARAGVPVEGMTVWGDEYKARAV